MRFELNEIMNANLIINEDEVLTDEITLLQNSEKIFQNLAGAYAISYEESPAALESLKKALNFLQDIGEYSKEISTVTDEFSDAYYKLEDLCREIRNLRDKTVFSQEVLDNALSRLDFIETLKRKYGGSVENVLKYADNLDSQLSHIENIDETKETLTKELTLQEAHLNEVSERLSKLRKQSASELEQKILSELKELNFNDSSLEISFTEENGYTANGIDKVEFLISTNKGEPNKPLSKIASGGEMSRIMLAFKKIIADYDGIPTMIFDEIDSGISGLTASIVGKKLRQIAEKHQVICITHLPQIAAFGAHSYKIQKDSDDNMTYTTVTKLDENEQITEIARLLGGMNITEKNLENARELVGLSK
jgi:DNA repair protein RecN (Recombination protein N)